MLFVVCLFRLPGRMNSGVIRFAGRAEQHSKLINGFMVIFAFSTDIANPRRKIRHGNHFAIQPSEIGHAGFMHLPNIAFAAWDHTVWFTVCSQIFALIAVILPFLSELYQFMIIFIEKC